MADIEKIRLAFQQADYQYTLHAVQRTTARHISRIEIEQAVGRSEVIEDYPDDKYGPSCLLYGVTDFGRPLHIQVSYPPRVKLITVYQPDPEEWEAYRKRKTS